MQAKERHIKRLIDKPLQIALISRVNHLDRKASSLKRFAGTLSRCQGNFTLVALAAAQQRDTTRTRINV